MDRGAKPQTVHHETGHLSAATCRSFGEARSFRHSTISQAVYSQDYPTKGRIDPSTYTFTDALRGESLNSNKRIDIQHTRSASARESKLSVKFSEGKLLNSKWDEAEKYISNPLSGEVPIQCLSSSVASKTWSECNHTTVRPVSRISKSAPLSFHSPTIVEIHPRNGIPSIEAVTSSEIGELKGRNGSWVRDVGTQITPLDYSSNSPSLTAVPIQEKRIDSFGLVGRKCCIFQRKPKSKLIGKELQENIQEEKKTKNSKTSGETREKKWVKTLFSWKMWWAVEQQRRKKQEKNRRGRPGHEKSEKDFTIITLQAALLQ